MMPATDVETLPPPEVLYHRRSSEIWSHGLDYEKNADIESSEGLLSKSHPFASSKTKFFFKNFVGPLTLLLTLLNVLQSVFILSMRSGSLNSCLSSTEIPELSLERSQARYLHRSSPFNSPNQTEANEAWHDILAGHGVVALSESYAKEHNLPQTSTHPYTGDTEAKRIYFVEAYHALHCVRMLRTLYHSYQHSLPLATFSPPDHDYHCFDRLRQYIMCNPDYTLVPNVAGHGKSDFLQPKKMCMDWDALRDWAEKWHGDYFDTFGIEESQKIKEGYDDVYFYENYRAGDGLPVGDL